MSTVRPRTAPWETTVGVVEMQGDGMNLAQEIRDVVEQKDNPPLMGFGGATSNNGRTDLHIAALQGHVQDVERILEIVKSSPIELQVATVNAKDIYGYTPLHLAVREQQEDVVRNLTASSLLLPDRFLAATSEVVDETEKECDGFTPLHMAAAAQQAAGTSRQLLSIVKLLLRRPACLGDQYSGYDPVNLRATTGKGFSPLEIAKQRGHGELVEFLECYDHEWLQLERAKSSNSMNAVLVGAALIAAASFATWLQPPLGIPNPIPDPVTPYDEERSSNSVAFFSFVAGAFYFSVAALLGGIIAMVPLLDGSLKSEVWKSRASLAIASWFLFPAVLSLTMAFVMASQLVLVKVAFADKASAHAVRQIIAAVMILCILYSQRVMFVHFVSSRY